MITIFNRDHDFVGMTCAYSGLSIESKVDTGDKTLSFNYEKSYSTQRLKASCRYNSRTGGYLYVYDYVTVSYGGFPIETEYYIQYDGDEYVVKGVNGTKIDCILNLEWLRASFYKDVNVKYITKTSQSASWTVISNQMQPTAGPYINFYDDLTCAGEANLESRRPVGMAEGDGLDLVYAICTAYMYEPVFDTINRKITLYTKVGTDTGVEFRKGLNLKTCNKKIDTYDYYTVIYPLGKNGREITNPDYQLGEFYHDTRDNVGINQTVYHDRYPTEIPANVLTDYSYSDKTRVYFWHDESYVDMNQMADDARMLLNDMSHPIISYDVKVRDLAKMSDDYDAFSFQLGDIIRIIDPDTQTYEKQRIIGMKIYPQDHDKDTMTLANTVLTYQEIQAKLTAAAKVIGQATHNGKVMLSAIEDIQVVNGTITYNSGYTSNQQYARRQLSQVTVSLYITGSFSTGTVTVGVIPSGFRPTSDTDFAVKASSVVDGEDATGKIDTNGNIKITTASSASWVSFTVTYITDEELPTG